MILNRKGLGPEPLQVTPFRSPPHPGPATLQCPLIQVQQDQQWRIYTASAAAGPEQNQEETRVLLTYTHTHTYTRARTQYKTTGIPCTHCLLDPHTDPISSVPSKRFVSAGRAGGMEDWSCRIKRTPPPAPDYLPHPGHPASSVRRVLLPDKITAELVPSPPNLHTAGENQAFLFYRIGI